MEDKPVTGSLLLHSLKDMLRRGAAIRQGREIPVPVGGTLRPGVMRRRVDTHRPGVMRRPAVTLRLEAIRHQGVTGVPRDLA
jgi:hypothetical protein